MGLKIIHIIPNLCKGGAERLVLDICEELSIRKDLDILLITFSDLNDYGEINSNFKWQVVNVKICLSLWKPNQIEVSSLQKIFEDFKPNVIHTHLFYAEIISRFCIYPKAKWISHVHDNMIQFQNLSFSTFFSKKKLVHWYEKKVLFRQYKRNGGTHFIAISRHTESYIKYVAKGYQVSLLFNGIKFSRFYFNKTVNCNSKIKLINVGSLVDKKNQNFLIEVAKNLKSQNVDFELLLVGDGPNRETLRHKIFTNKLEENVKLMGMVSKVEDLYKQGDFYVHSATYEPLGLVLLEAMAAGLPVLTTDGEGNRDLIVQNENGVLFDSFDVNNFSATIINLYQNENKRKEMASKAISFAQKHDIQPYVDNLLNLYRS